jgi:hypothetical protein
MTLPDERYRAIKYAAEFMQRLAGGQYARVPKAVRGEAASILRHYPSEYELGQIEQFAPHVIQQRMEPLYKMIKQHEMAESVSKDYRAEGMIKQHETAAKRIDLDDPNWEPHT